MPAFGPHSKRLFTQCIITLTDLSEIKTSRTLDPPVEADRLSTNSCSNWEKKTYHIANWSESQSCSPTGCGFGIERNQNVPSTSKEAFVADLISSLVEFASFSPIWGWNGVSHDAPCRSLLPFSEGSSRRGSQYSVVWAGIIALRRQCA